MKNTATKILRTITAVIFAAVFFLNANLPAKAARVPEIQSSKAAMLYCMESDTVLYSKGEGEKMNPGVLTKLMVAVVAIEEAGNSGLSLDSYFTASKKAINSTLGKHISMKNGEVFKIRDLISAIIHVDADDAANVLAEGIADDTGSFVELMNNKAKDLGMNDTKYFKVTATYDDQSYTTAADQVKLASYALKIYQLSQIALEKRVVIDKTNKSDTRYYGTTNYLLTTRVNPDYYLENSTGFLCGTVEGAGYCGILTSKKDGLNFIAVVMGAENSRVLVNPERTETDENGNTVTLPAEYKTIFHGLHEARSLLVYGESSFGYIKAVSTATPIVDIPVKLGSGNDKAVLLPEYDLELFVPDGIDKNKEIKYTYTLDVQYLTAPVKAGTKVGMLYVSYKGETIGEIPLVVKSNIEQDGYLVLLTRLKELISTPFFIVLIALTVFAAVFYVLSNAVLRQKKTAQRIRETERQYIGDGKHK